MLILYTSPGCASCRKVKQWFKTHEIEYVEKNIFSTILNEKEIRYLLSRSENGTEDIISPRSKIIRDSKIDIEEMGINELIRFTQHNPSILKRPIIMDEKNMMIGYDEEEMDLFLPKVRELAKVGCSLTCPNYEICGRLREEETNEA